MVVSMATNHPHTHTSAQFSHIFMQFIHFLITERVAVTSWSKSTTGMASTASSTPRWTLGRWSTSSTTTARTPCHDTTTRSTLRSNTPSQGSTRSVPQPIRIYRKLGVMYRENSENGTKKSLSGKTEGIWKFCQNTGKTEGIWLAQVVDSLILKVTDISKFAAKNLKKNKYLKLDKSAKSVLCM